MAINKIVFAAISVIVTITAGILMAILGGYAMPTVILTLLVIWVFVGLIYLVVWFLVLRPKPKTVKDFELSPDEAYAIGKQKMLSEYGLIEGIQEYKGSEAVGTDKEKDTYFLWIFRDRQFPEIRMGYFRNLKKIHIEGNLMDDGKMEKRSFIRMMEEQMKKTMVPMKEHDTFVEKIYDERGNLVKTKEGVQSPMMVINQQQEKKEVEVTPN
jgi:hypothetical protein